MHQWKDRDGLNGYKNKTHIYAAYNKGTYKQGEKTDPLQS